MEDEEDEGDEEDEEDEDEGDEEESEEEVTFRPQRNNKRAKKSIESESEYEEEPTRARSKRKDVDSDSDDDVVFQVDDDEEEDDDSEEEEEEASDDEVSSSEEETERKRKRGRSTKNTKPKKQITKTVKRPRVSAPLREPTEGVQNILAARKISPSTTTTTTKSSTVKTSDSTLVEEVDSTTTTTSNVEFLVKFRGKSYRDIEWVAGDQLLEQYPSAKIRVRRVIATVPLPNVFTSLPHPSPSLLPLPTSSLSTLIVLTYNSGETQSRLHNNRQDIRQTCGEEENKISSQMERTGLRRMHMGT